MSRRAAILALSTVIALSVAAAPVSAGVQSVGESCVVMWVADARYLQAAEQKIGELQRFSPARPPHFVQALSAAQQTFFLATDGRAPPHFPLL